jgi:hypothetical protein
VPKPMLQALVLADHVYQDKATGKMVIAGTFNRLHVFKQDASCDIAIRPAQDAEQQPDGLRKLKQWEILKVGSPWVYVSLTELRGTVPLELRYVDLSNNVVILRFEFSVKSSSPLDTMEVAVPLPPLPTPHSGAYALELLSNDEPLGSHRVAVTDTPAPDQETAEGKG